jgi:hypothetical protein
MNLQRENAYINFVSPIVPVDKAETAVEWRRRRTSSIDIRGSPQASHRPGIGFIVEQKAGSVLVRTKIITNSDYFLLDTGKENWLNQD